MSDYTYDALVRDIHDGDTVILDVDLGFKVWISRMNVRLFGINAPELATPEGESAKAFLNSLLHIGDKVILQSQKDHADKYGGRWLGIILQGGHSVNDAMVGAGHAKPWDGKGTKPV